MSLSGEYLGNQEVPALMWPINSRLPKARRTCVMAESVASSVGFEASTSSHNTSDSSTFCDRTKASDFKAWLTINDESVLRVNEQTLIRSLLGCFFSSLLQATMADLFDPLSMESNKRTGKQGYYETWPQPLAVDWAYLTLKSSWHVE